MITLETDIVLTAAEETKHTITTSDGKTIHKKMASNPLKFQPSKKADETRKPTKRCTRCGLFSNDDLCDTHKKVNSEEQKKLTSTKTLPTKPAKQTKEIPDIFIISKSPKPKNYRPRQISTPKSPSRPISSTATATQTNQQTSRKTAKHQPFHHRSDAARS